MPWALVALKAPSDVTSDAGIRGNHTGSTSELKNILAPQVPLIWKKAHTHLLSPERIRLIRGTWYQQSCGCQRLKHLKGFWFCSELKMCGFVGASISIHYITGLFRQTLGSQGGKQLVSTHWLIVVFWLYHSSQAQKSVKGTQALKKSIDMLSWLVKQVETLLENLLQILGSEESIQAKFLSLMDPSDQYLGLWLSWILASKAALMALRPRGTDGSLWAPSPVWQALWIHHLTHYHSTSDQLCGMLFVTYSYFKPCTINDDSLLTNKLRIWS